MNDPAEIARMVAECLNCLGVIASPEAFKQLDTPQRRAEFRQGIDALLAAYLKLSATLRLRAGGDTAREMAFVAAEPLLQDVRATLAATGLEDEALLRRQVIAFLNVFGAAMNIQSLGDLLAVTPLEQPTRRGAPR